MAIQPGNGKRDISDGAVAGLLIRISPNGSKHWLFRYTWKKARPRIALGQFPAVGIAEARKLALECNEWLERGVDPRRAARPHRRTAKKDVQLDIAAGKTNEQSERRQVKHPLPSLRIR